MITITEYGRLKTPKAKAPDQRFLLNPTNNARKNPKQSIYWYGCCPMGYKQVSKLLPKAIERACPEVDAKKMKITGNSWRKTTVQAGADAGVNGAMMSKILGHANLESKLAYMKESNEAHTAIGLSLNRTIMGKQNKVSQRNQLFDKTGSVLFEFSITVCRGLEGHNKKLDRPRS